MNRRSLRTLRRLVPGLLVVALAAIAPAGAQTVPAPDSPATRPAARPRIDMVFVLDATGSMGDEIEPVKRHLWSIANRALTAAERAEDGSVLAQRGVLRAARPNEAVAFGSDEGDAPHARGARSAAAPAPVTNNIADQVTRRVQDRARDLGVAY